MPCTVVSSVVKYCSAVNRQQRRLGVHTRALPSYYYPEQSTQQLLCTAYCQAHVKLPQISMRNSVERIEPPFERPHVVQLHAVVL